jgi:HK97 family phage prohead protease
MDKHVALFEVKAITDGADPHGEFEAVLSVPVVDRDGEVVDGGAFNPLPAEIPIHKYHDFSAPVATAVPFYDGDVLKARGVFDPDPESQAIRQKIGRSIRYMSVGFMAAERADQDGVPHITRAELLEASFVSVPSNREAAILAVKAHTAKPFENEHACRLEDPGQFTRFRRDNTKDPNVIIGFRSDGTSAAQAFRYPIGDWTEARARAHCDEHDGSFEPASKIWMPTASSSSSSGAIAVGRTVFDHRPVELKVGRTLSRKNEENLKEAARLIGAVLEQLAAPEEDGGAADKSAATDPEEKAAAPAAADEAAAAAAAQPPAEATAGHQLRVALLRLEADLAAMNAAH